MGPIKLHFLKLIEKNKYTKDVGSIGIFHVLFFCLNLIYINVTRKKKQQTFSLLTAVYDNMYLIHHILNFLRLYRLICLSIKKHFFFFSFYYIILLYRTLW